MALTVAEANAVNDVLAYLMNRHEPEDFVEAARKAGQGAEVLAASSFRKLGAGISVRDVQTSWGLLR